MLNSINGLKANIERELNELCEKTEKNMTICDAEAIYYLTEAYCGVERICGGKTTSEIEKTKTEYKTKAMDAVTAESWVKTMENSDGTRGGHWKMEETTAVLENNGIRNISKPLFYAVMNMLYSDYGAVAKRYGLEANVGFWVDMAKAWIFDKDAKPEKTSLYYAYVVDK